MDKLIPPVSNLVDRVSNLQNADFRKNYFDAEKPVVIENAIDDWTSLKWSLRSIKEKAGHNSVFVRRNTSHENYQTGKKYNIESMKFSEYIENIERNNEKAFNSYLAVQNIKRALPELEADIKLPEYVPKVHSGPYLWIAREGHYEFCHFDPDDNFLIVISGRKLVRLYPVAELDKLYPNQLGSKGRTIQSNVNCNSPDLLKHPDFANVQAYECVLNAGDMLYFPAFWWHQVTSTEVTISVNIFCGDEGTNKYLTKVMRGNPWIGFKYWLLNIIEQNRSKEQFQKVLQYLPGTLAGFLLKQWHEVPTEQQLNKLVTTVLDHCELEGLPKTTVELKHPPPLKIRGLLWRS